MLKRTQYKKSIHRSKQWREWKGNIVKNESLNGDHSLSLVIALYQMGQHPENIINDVFPFIFQTHTIVTVLRISLKGLLLSLSALRSLFQGCCGCWVVPLLFGVTCVMGDDEAIGGGWIKSSEGVRHRGCWWGGTVPNTE